MPVLNYNLTSLRMDANHVCKRVVSITRFPSRRFFVLIALVKICCTIHSAQRLPVSTRFAFTVRIIYKLDWSKCRRRTDCDGLSIAVIITHTLHNYEFTEIFRHGYN